MDPKSGFSFETKIYHSLRLPALLPPETAPLSVADFVFFLLHSSPPPPTAAALIDATTGRRTLYTDFILRVRTLASSLHNRLGLRKGDSAFVLSPNSLHIPILYLALFSLGVIVSPSNPSSTMPEVSRQIRLSGPVIAFATSKTAHKIPPLRFGSVLVDSPEFESLMTGQIGESRRVEVSQTDTATILYSSGTSGRFKGVELTHRNWISVLAGAHVVRAVRRSPAVDLCTVPYFHAYGIIYCVRALAFGECVVAMERFNLVVMVRAIEEFRVSHVAAAPPVILAMVRDEDVMDGCDLSSLEVVVSGGSSLGKGFIERFRKRFPHVQLVQGYGLTESTAGIARQVGPKESQVIGSVGKLDSNCQAKIVDPDTGIGLPPSKSGELWIRGLSIMKGYVGDKEADAAILDSEGWLRTGDLCYFDNEGFLFFVDRIKETIKYKGYQVAPAELEDLLQSHPDIIDAAVVPYPDEEAGQVPMAFLVRRFGSTIDESKIKDFISKEVAPYKRIRRVMFVNSIPKNAPGKILRKELIKLALSSDFSKL